MGQSSKPLPSQEEIWGALEYDPSTGQFCWCRRADRSKGWNTRRAGKPAGDRHAGNGYVYITINRVKYVAHRLAWVYVYGDVSAGLEVDHHNLVRDDNRLENLRLASSSENKANGRHYRNNASGLKGAYFKREMSRWESQIRVNGRLQSLGYFDSAEQAHAAYVEAAERYFGAFARP